MGRLKKYQDSTTKTSTAQKEAVKRYRKKNPGLHKTISITLPSVEANRAREVIKAHGTTPAKVWRDAMARLSAEPLPPSED